MHADPIGCGLYKYEGCPECGGTGFAPCCDGPPEPRDAATPNPPLSGPHSDGESDGS